MVLRLLVLAALAGVGFAQNLSVGVIAGANLSRGIQSTTAPIAGAMIKWSLPRNLSLEFDGVWHSYPAGHQLGANVTWEFPVLARYGFSLPFGKPFVEAGPSFRTGAPADSGFTAGAGVEFHIWHNLSIAPMLRYTHWASTSASLAAGWNPNQVEFLAALTSTSDENIRPLGANVSLGVVLGSTLTADFRSVAETGPVQYGSLPPFTATSVSIGESGFQIGPSVEIQLPMDLALEIDAMHCPLPELNYWSVPNGTALTASESAALSALNAAARSPADVTWEFPVVAKYEFLLSRAEPLVELGPSFRLPQEVNGGRLSSYGITGGVGIEVHLFRLRIEPVIRFTRWASDTPAGSTRYNRNQLEFLAVFSL